MTRPRDPRQKKIRSYERDCRNNFAEGGSKARKVIAKRKAQASRALRKRVRDELWAKIMVRQEAEEFDLQVNRQGRRSFRKAPDTPLAYRIQSRVELRPRRGMSGKTMEKPYGKTIKTRQADFKTIKTRQADFKKP